VYDRTKKNASASFIALGIAITLLASALLKESHHTFGF
jgi:hypothetical protein